MTVLEAYRVVNGNMVWLINIKRNLNDWEVKEFEDLMSTLESAHVSDSDDQVVWNLEKNGIFWSLHTISSYTRWVLKKEDYFLLSRFGRLKFLHALLFLLGRVAGKKSLLLTG